MKSLLIWPVVWYLRLLAHIALRLHKPTVIGIAGSAGKTSTRNALLAVLQDHFPTKTVGNSETGVPLGMLGIIPDGYGAGSWLKTLLKAPFGIMYLKKTKYLIAEMAIDDPYKPKNMEFLLTVIKPDIAIELNVSVANGLPAHAMQFEKLLKDKQVFDKHEFLTQKIAEEDTKIITKSNCSTGIYNIDDLYVQSELVEFEKAHPHAHVLTFGKSSQNDVSYGSYLVNLTGSTFDFVIKTGAKKEKVQLQFKNMLLPQAYREVFAATILTGLEIGLSLHQVTTSLQKNYTLPKSRASLFAGINGSVIIDSSYNAARASMLTFLDMVKMLKKESGREVVFLFGDMRELGSESKTEHQEVAKYLLGIVDYLYLVGEQTKEFVLPIIESGYSSSEVEKNSSRSRSVQNSTQTIKEVRHFDNAREAGLYLKNHLPRRSIVLVKGSQNTIFLEEAIKFMLKNKEDEKKLCRQDEHFLKIKFAQYGS